MASLNGLVAARHLSTEASPSSNASSVQGEDTHKTFDMRQPVPARSGNATHISLTSSRLKSLIESDVDLVALCDALLILWRLNMLLVSCTQRKRDATMERYGLRGSNDERPGSPQRSNTSPSDLMTYEDRLAALTKPFPGWPLKNAALPSITSLRQGWTVTASNESAGESSVGDRFLYPDRAAVIESESLEGDTETHSVHGDLDAIMPAGVTSRPSTASDISVVPSLDASRSQDLSPVSTNAGGSSISASLRPTEGSLAVSAKNARIGLWHRAKNWLAGHKAQPIT